MLARLVIWILNSKRIKGESKALIFNALLENIGSLPIKDIFTHDLSGTVRVNGKDLTPEQAISLKEGAVALNKNWTYNLIREQVAYEAVKMGVHSSLNLDMVMFSKAALWHQEQEKKLISQLIGEEVA